MPTMTVNGVALYYRIVGERGPWLALITGGRRGHDEFVPLAQKIAARGFRVLLHDRRNTGASDILIGGKESEEEIWTDDLVALLGRLDALPAYVGGASSGARTAVLTYLRHPAAVKGLLLLRVTGGEFAANRLPENYYGQFIRAAQEGGMAAVCATEQFRERIAANPANEPRLMEMNPQEFVAVYTRWKEALVAGGKHTMMGVSDADLRSVAVPTLVIPGNDKVHNSTVGRAVQKLIPGSVLHELPVTDQDVPMIPFPEWAPYENEIARVFAGFMRAVED